MQLVGEAIGVGVAIWWLPRLVGASAGLNAYTAVTVAVGLVLAGTFIWPAGRGLFDDGRHDAALTPAAAAVAGSAFAPANADFFAWAAVQIPANAKFVFFGPASPELWGSYQLTPRRQVTDIASADFLVFYDTPPASAGAALAFFPRRRTFAPNFAIAARP